MKLSLLAAALLWAAPSPATAQVAILHIQVIEGEGAVYAPGSHGTRPVTVQVTDETGKPVEGAAVSFHLPEEGPGGTFGSGLRTDVVVTDYRGRASLHNLQLNRISGRFQVRIVAMREQARAGIVCSQFISDPKGGAATASASSSAPARPDHPTASRGVLKWVLLAAIAGGAAAAGALVAGRSGAAAPSSQPAITASTPTISIATPSITVGKP